jgi:CRISPR-associated protein Cas8a1/Csx13
MTLRLYAPGMTALHKAGLAGLYMTLRAFEEKEQAIEGLTWQLEPQRVILHWTDETPKAAFEELIKRSFRVDDKGFIRFTGLEREREMTFAQRHHLYNALLNSFLQYGKHREKSTKTTLSYDVGDDKIYWLKDFEPIKQFIHRKVVEDNNIAKEWIDNNGLFRDEVEIIGWLYPGGSVRHVDSSSQKATTLREPFGLALLLLFAPIGVIYYNINSKINGRKTRAALLLPEIRDLEAYAGVRQLIAAQGVLELTASSASDAVLRMLLTIETNSLSNEFAKLMRQDFLCRAVTFGIVPWNEKQKSRTSTRSIFSGSLSGFENYRLAAALFKNRWQQVSAKRNEPARYFVTTFCAREFIADNIASNKVWYHNIADCVTRKETREQLFYERKELGRMVEEARFDDERERLFIKVCHESWRRRLGKLGERATRESANFPSLARKEAERLRTSLARCKNADTLRETVVDFWSRGGGNELLQGDGLISLLPLFSERNWRKSKDLALLALVSYQPQSTEEADALKIESTLKGDETQ